ncbi:acetyltransferase (GNAT) family protein [Azospirillum brasilense]|uniref:Acetyltransferase (GNAT) family protein n=1 Tax=Azospirillum brasilense TaxID=192 RepID=A0A560AL33_AZOBR|nr:acetyltransferase (GNAT) family protein [Azospirillum brasilense]
MHARPGEPEGLLQGRVEGYLEGVGETVTGWAWLPDHPARRLRVTVLFDGHPVTTFADRHRDDLKAAGKGDGCCGFAVPVPDAFAGREHKVDVRLPDFPDLRLRGAPRTTIPMLGPVILRRVPPGEAVRLHAFLAGLAGLHGAGEAAVPDMAAVQAWLAAPDRCWLTAERAGAIVGHCRVGPDWPAEPREGALALGIELHPDVQGFGLGRHLMQAAHRWAAGWCARVELAVLPHNDRARRLYRSLGYADSGMVRLPVTGEPHCHMAIALPAIAPAARCPFVGCVLVV